MNFRKYQHVERFGTTEVKNIELGQCHIFSKIDGTNSSIWLGDDRELHAGSRNRALSLNKDNAGFYAYASSNNKLIKLVKENPNLRFYGEWLVPHSLKTYQQKAWKNFYIFDVVRELEDDKFEYLEYEEYKALLDIYCVDYIPLICSINNCNYEQLIENLSKNNFLIEDGKGFGEGIIIKNYKYKNQFGNTIWAKIVAEEFKNKKLHKNNVTVIEKTSDVEYNIVNKYVTISVCEKAFNKIVEERGHWKSKYIPILLNTVFYDLINEECWHFIKYYKYPCINFKTLQQICFTKVKELMNNLF